MKNTALYKQFSERLACLTTSNTGLTVALSGGVDSVVLLHLCKTYQSLNPPIALEAIYIDHGLSKHTKKWGEFCESLAQRLAIEFKQQSIVLDVKPRQSLEAIAREARYSALDELAAPDNVIVLGQHGDDQLETFLLRLKRGSGLKGLSAMQASTFLASGRVCIRPLLSIARTDIEAFASTFALEHIEDESNQDNKFDRNYLRNQVIPLLKQRFNGFLNSSLRSIELLQQQQALLDELTAQDLAKCVNSIAQPATLCVNALSQFSNLRQANVLRAWLESLAVAMPSRVQLEQVLNQALQSREDAQMQVQLSKGSVRRYNNKLYWVVNQVVLHDIEDIGTENVTLSDGRKLVIKMGSGVRLPSSDERVSIRFALLKHQIQPVKKQRPNTVKYWLKESKVPTWQRELIPLVFYNDTLVQVVGHFVAKPYAVEQNGIQWEIS